MRLPFRRQLAIDKGTRTLERRTEAPRGIDQLTVSTAVAVDGPQPRRGGPEDLAGLAIDGVEYDALVVHPPEAVDIRVQEPGHDLGLTGILHVEYGQLHPPAIDRHRAGKVSSAR